MDQDETIWHLEEALWTSGRESARVVTAADAIVVLPYPNGILQGDGIWSNTGSDSGWRLVELSNRSILRKQNVVVLAYSVLAEKHDVPEYRAFCTSTWLKDAGSWRRLAHQQTPEK